MKSLVVVPDTNVLDRDRGLTDKWVRALLRACRDGNELSLVFPEVVVTELVHHQRGAFRKATRQVKDSVELLNQFAPEPVTVPELPVVEDLAKTYETWLRATIGDAGGSVAPLPKVSLEEILWRAVKKEAPFHGSDSGFRDVLIWLSVLELAEEGADVALCSSDTGFMEGKDPQLGAVLKNELVARGLSENAVRLFASIEAVVREHITPDPVLYLVEAVLREPTETIIDALATGAERERLNIEAAQLISESAGTQTIEIMSPADPLYVELLEEPVVDDIEVEDVQEADGGILVTLTITAEPQVRYGLEHSDSDGAAVSWKNIAVVDLRIPATVFFNPVDNSFGPLSIDDEISWGTIEDYEPLPW